MNKNLVFLISLYFSSNVIGMEAISHQKENVLSIIPNDNRKEYNLVDIKMSDIKPEEQQWWYLDQRFEHQGYVQSLLFNPNNTCLITTSCDRYHENYTATSFDIASNKIIAEFPCSESSGKSICYNPSTTLMATRTATHRAIACEYRAFITDTVSQKTITSFRHPEHIHDMSFDNSGELFATASGKMVRIFKQYEDYTLEQLQLKQAMNTWLLLKKPVLIIKKEKIQLKDILLALLKEIADTKIIVPYFEQLAIEDELLNIWNTFPTNMQFAILRTMKRKIQRYGYITTSQSQLFSLGCITTSQSAYQSYAQLVNTYRQNWNS